MRLPAIPFLTKTEKTEFFLALLFETDKISGILFQEQDKTLVILASHEAKIALEEAPIEDLVAAPGNVISRLEASFPEVANLETTIFAVPYTWVEDGKIKAPRLSELKKISVELALTPVGFIISIEAIVVFLQKKEGAPVNGIFVELSDKSLTVFLVRSGSIIEVKHGVIAENVEETVEKLLEGVEKLDVLPSKIILLNSEEAEHIQQKFLSYNWTKNLPFQHLPQVAILERGFENEAIINGVATQMGAQIKGEVSVSKFEEMEENEERIDVIDDNFGFVKEKDVKNIVEKIPVEKKEEIVIKHAISPHDMPEKEVLEDGYYNQEEEPTETKKSNFLSSFISSVIPINLSFNFFRIKKIFKNGKSFVIPVAALILVIALLGFYYSLILRANVSIFTDKKAFKDSLGITLTTSGISSFSDKTLKISTITEIVSGEESQETTGKLETGKKATGEVTVFNKTEDPKTLDKGAVIISSNGLEFVINDDIKIASTSSFSTSFSSQKVKVSANLFGKEYNIPSSTNFTVKRVATSDLFAKNEAAFSGGTKEEIQVVSDKDLDTLSETITKRLFSKAKNQASIKLNSDDALIPVMLSSEFKEKDFDKKEKEKATAIKLKATITFTLGVYKKEEFSKFISSSKDFNIPKDFKLSDKESEISISDIKQNKNDVSAKFSFNAIFKPAIDNKKIPKLIAGKSKKSAEDRIKAISGVSDVAIRFSNKLPLLPEIIPLRGENITVEMKTQ